MQFDTVYYEPDALSYPLGNQLRAQFAHLPWEPIESHNRIDALRGRPNADFARLKRCLIVGVRKTHRYVENHKISDYLVPYTSSGCTAMCLYCYLVCHYNTCSYLRLFVNREQMLGRLLKRANEAGREMTFEIGSNSDLVLENTITGNLPWTIEAFARQGRGFLTFPTKFHQVEPLLPLRHDGRVIFRMSVNPPEVIRRVELGTSPLDRRIAALNRMGEAGYRVGVLIAPVIFLENWRESYGALLEQLAQQLSPAVKRRMTVEVIFMTYSYLHRAINAEAFPHAPDLYAPGQMAGRGKGKYAYLPALRAEGEEFLRRELRHKLPEAELVYFS